MNGLVAIFKKQEVSAYCLTDLLETGLQSLTHRGGDARAIFLMDSRLRCVNRSLGQPEPGVSLGLASCSKQNDTTHIASYDRNMLFFDGCLLDKAELAGQLPVAPEHVTDAELVLRLLEQQGVGCLKRLKGFWSLIYLDARNKTLYGARDHFGNRPMWFCHTGRHFALASEGRTLYSMLEDVRRINKERVIDFLLWGEIGRKDQYFFRDIHSLEPSHFVKYEMETDRLTVERYDTLPYNRSNTSYNVAAEKQYTDEIRRLMTDSVDKNLRLFDGSVAIGLSGGMDSSALACLARKTHPDKDVTAYTTTNEYDDGESRWAEIVVRHTGMEWVKVLCTPRQLIDDIKRLNGIHSAPIYNASSFTQYRLLEEMAKDGHTAVLDGQGGDEMFGGYQTYFPLFLRSLRKNGEWKNGWNELIHVRHSGMTLREMYMRMLKEWAKTHVYTPLRMARWSRRDIYDSLMPNARDAYFKSLSLMSEAHDTYSKSLSLMPGFKKEVLNDLLFESYTLFLGNILRWGEHAAASKGLECVMPLSDSPDLTEYVFSIPSSFKIHNGWNKYLQRRAMVGIVPDAICWRKEKMGFYFPERQWLSALEGVMYDAIERMDDPEGCLCKTRLLAQRSRLFTSSHEVYRSFIFRCYSYLVWRNGLDVAAANTL